MAPPVASTFASGSIARLARAGACALLFLLVGAPAIAEISDAEAIRRLEAAVDQHPDDPDLHFTLASKLARAGRGSEAIRQTRSLLARWPDRRADARVEIAGSLIEAGDTAQALILLDEDLRARPRSGTTRFYRGLAFRAQGAFVESNREFELARRLAPSLRAESLLAQALGLFELGQEAEAVDLLRQILAIDPTSETAIRARLMLRQREVVPLERAWRLDAHAGFEWDDNVLLENATNESIGSGRKDFRGVWGAGGTLRALTTERGSITLGYRYDQTAHDDLDRFDLITNSGFASGSFKFSQGLLFRLDALAWNTRQDGENQLTAGTIRPNLIFSFSPTWGALRAFAQYEVFEYATDPLFKAWERDGFSFGGGLEHFIPLPIAGSYLSTSASYQRNLTQAMPSGAADAFDGDYDHDSTRVRLRANLRLPYAFRSVIEAGYTNDRYHNVNFLNPFLGVLRFQKREDDIASARVSISREIVSHVEIESYWRGTWRMSNVPFFDYDQQVVGVLLRISTN